MNRFCPAPALGFFGKHARIIEPHLIEEVAVAVWTSSPCRRGDRIDDGGKVALAPLPRLFSHFSIINIGARTVPPKDFAGLVPQSLRANEKPSINAIVPAKTCLEFARFP